MEDGAAQFEKQAGSLKNKYASNNLIVAAVVGVLVLGGFYWYLFMQPPPAPGVVIVKLPFFNSRLRRGHRVGRIQ